MKRKANKVQLLTVGIVLLALLASITVTVVPVVAVENIEQSTAVEPAEKTAELTDKVETEKDTVPVKTENDTVSVETEDDTAPNIEAKNVPALMALRPAEVDLKDEETSVTKIDKSQDRYEMPDNTAYVILKQAHGTLVIWSTDSVEEENKSDTQEKILGMAQEVDGSIKGGETVFFISGEGEFNLGELLSEKNWGNYKFEVNESGEVILTCDADKISHIDYVTGKKEEEPKPTEPKPTEPKPTEPKPTEPKPTEPKPTEPKPTEPKPTEPKPTEPKPTEPKPTEPKPTEPKPTEPTSTTKSSTSSAENPKTGDNYIGIITALVTIPISAILFIACVIKVKRKPQ